MTVPRHPIELRAIDSHTGGEPTRLIVDGFPDLGNGSMAERRQRFAREFDRWRQAVITEPRGNDVLVGALLCKPVSPQATAGVIFFNNAGFLNMCGHGTIGLIASLAWLGRIKPGIHLIETPVGNVSATLHEDGSVSVENVPARRGKSSSASTPRWVPSAVILPGAATGFPHQRSPFHPRTRPNSAAHRVCVGRT